MATIEIDGKSYQAEVGQMLIEVTDAAGITVPRFCYHKKLSVAANCRMCLVEVEKAPKPMPACATPVMDGMKVFTRSPKALAAQKAVMEFLLINHPLDCPICDQGGECELQDVAMGYGKHVSRYQEIKRVVADKDIGPLIATEMTRCIHCTRCVRFGEEIAGIRELGATGRGERTRIGTYVESSVASELSGNVIDLCPVGALTSKPFRFSARPWELRQQAGIAPHDALGSNIYLHTLQNRKVVRVVPRENEAINEVWLSDRDRFSYEGLQAEDRLTTPWIKKDGAWRQSDWESALAFAAERLGGVKRKHGAAALGGLAAPLATLEELYLLQKLLRGLGSNNLDHRLRQADFRDQAAAPLYPGLGQKIADLEQCDTALLIGSHLRQEQPLLNHRLRKAVLRNQAKVMLLNPLDYEFNFPIAEKLVTAPDGLVGALAGIAKALLEDRAIKSSPAGSLDLLAKVQADSVHKAIAGHLLAGKRKTLLLGGLATAHPDFSIIRALAGMIAAMCNATLGYAGETGNGAGAWLAGMLPHRGPGGEALAGPGLDAQAMLRQGLKAYVLLHLEPELDSLDGAAALAALREAECVVALSAYRTPALDSYADVLLPVALFAETSGTYVNLEGTWQSCAGAVPPPGEARPAWKVLRVLGNLLDVKGFDYTASEQVAEEARQRVGEQPAPAQDAWLMPAALPEASAGQALQRITEMPMYAVDAVVRRAASLQQTRDAQAARGVHLAPGLAARLGIAAGAQVTLWQNGASVALPAVLDGRVPEACVLVYAGQSAGAPLGAWHGPVELSAGTAGKPT